MNLKEVSALGVEEYRKIFPFPVFNVVQSLAFEDAYFSDCHLVVAAPTGSGKTVVFELALLNLLNRGLIEEDVKAVYVAPIKALCSERFRDWCSRLGPLGFRCVEITGDQPMAEEADSFSYGNLIVTTPEKFDSISRRYLKDAIRKIKLFMIDEIHLINEENRGPVLEAVITRVKILSSQIGTSTRFISASATIPNCDDLIEWLDGGTGTGKVIRVSDDRRPVKVQRIVMSYKSQANFSRFKFDIMLNYKLPSLIQQYSNGKPTLIFCSTRKGTQQAANYLSQQSTLPVTPGLRELSKLVKEPKLKEVIQRGIAFHHAGLDPADRRTIEEAFLQGRIPVLLATTTLAMGVNLPAHLVIVRSTFLYGTGTDKDYDASQLLQMIGRAGRPQFDTFATAIIMTTEENKMKYEKLLHGIEPIESSLHLHLKEHLNSEVVLQTISSLEVALDWLKSSFLYIRVHKNPKHYGFPTALKRGDLDLKLQDLCVRNLNGLATYGLIYFDELQITPTEIGKMMSKSYLAFETMKMFTELKGIESLAQLLAKVSACYELQDFTLRVNERKTLNTLNRDSQKVTVRFPLNGRVKSTDMKVNILIQAALGCLTVADPSLSLEVQKAVRLASRVAKCLVRFLWYKTQTDLTNKFALLLSAVTLCKCLHCKLWENTCYVTRQIDRVGPALSRLLVEAGIASFASLEGKNPRDVELIVNRNAPFGNRLLESARRLPKYSLSVKQIGLPSANEAKIQIDVSLENCDLLINGATAGLDHCAILLVGNDANDILFRYKIKDETLASNNGKFSKVLKVDEGKIIAHLLSEFWAGLDVSTVFTPFFTQEKFVSGMNPGSARISKKRVPAGDDAYSQVQPPDPNTLQSTKTKTENSKVSRHLQMYSEAVEKLSSVGEEYGRVTLPASRSGTATFYNPWDWENPDDYEVSGSGPTISINQKLHNDQDVDDMDFGTDFIDQLLNDDFEDYQPDRNQDLHAFQNTTYGFEDWENWITPTGEDKECVETVNEQVPYANTSGYNTRESNGIVDNNINVEDIGFDECDWEDWTVNTFESGAVFYNDSEKRSVDKQQEVPNERMVLTAKATPANGQLQVLATMPCIPTSSLKRSCINGESSEKSHESSRVTAHPSTTGTSIPSQPKKIRIVPKQTSTKIPSSLPSKIPSVVPSLAPKAIVLPHQQKVRPSLKPTLGNCSVLPSQTYNGIDALKDGAIVKKNGIPTCGEKESSRSKQTALFHESGVNDMSFSSNQSSPMNLNTSVQKAIPFRSEANHMSEENCRPYEPPARGTVADIELSYASIVRGKFAMPIDSTKQVLKGQNILGECGDSKSDGAASTIKFTHQDTSLKQRSIFQPTEPRLDSISIDNQKGLQSPGTVGSSVNSDSNHYEDYKVPTTANIAQERLARNGRKGLCNLSVVQPRFPPPDTRAMVRGPTFKSSSKEECLLKLEQHSSLGTSMTLKSSLPQSHDEAMQPARLQVNLRPYSAEKGFELASLPSTACSGPATDLEQDWQSENGKYRSHSDIVETPCVVAPHTVEENAIDSELAAVPLEVSKPTYQVSSINPFATQSKVEEETLRNGYAEAYSASGLPVSTVANPANDQFFERKKKFDKLTELMNFIGGGVFTPHTGAKDDLYSEYLPGQSPFDEKLTTNKVPGGQLNAVGPPAQKGHAVHSTASDHSNNEEDSSPSLYCQIAVDGNRMGREVGVQSPELLLDHSVAPPSQLHDGTAPVVTKSEQPSWFAENRTLGDGCTIQDEGESEQSRLHLRRSLSIEAHPGVTFYDSPAEISDRFHCSRELVSSSDESSDLPQVPAPPRPTGNESLQGLDFQPGMNSVSQNTSAANVYESTNCYRPLTTLDSRMSIAQKVTMTQSRQVCTEMQPQLHKENVTLRKCSDQQSLSHTAPGPTDVRRMQMKMVRKPKQYEALLSVTKQETRPPLKTNNSFLDILLSDECKDVKASGKSDSSLYPSTLPQERNEGRPFPTPQKYSDSRSSSRKYNSAIPITFRMGATGVAPMSTPARASNTPRAHPHVGGFFAEKGGGRMTETFLRSENELTFEMCASPVMQTVPVQEAVFGQKRPAEDDVPEFIRNVRLQRGKTRKLIKLREVFQFEKKTAEFF